MALVPLTNLGRFGIIQDRPPHTLPLEAWSAGQNVCFRDGNVTKIKGHQSRFSTPSVAPYWILEYADPTTLYYFYANASAIYRTNGVAHTDVTRTVGGAYSAGAYPRWTGGVLGGVPFMNHNAGTDYPQEYNSATPAFQNMTSWPANWYAKVLRAYGNFILALDVTKSGTRYPTLMQWSHSAEPGTMPSTWVAASTNEAGSKSFSETTKFLVDCLPLGRHNIVYKEDSVYSQAYVSGEVVFTFERIFQEFGLLSIGCVQNFFGKHFVVSQGDIILHDGVHADSLVYKRQRNKIFNTIDPSYADRTFVAQNPAKHEIWVCVPETGAGGVPTKAFIWNWKENTWGERDLPSVPYILTGLLGADEDTTFDGGIGTTFDADIGIFDERSYNPSELRLLYGRTTVSDFLEGDVTDQISGVNFTSYIERTGLPIAGVDRDGNPVVDPGSIKLLRRIYPHMEASDGTTVEISIASQMELNGTITWHGPYTFDPNSDLFVDCIVSGRFLGYKIASNGNGNWALSGLTLDLDKVSAY